LSKARAGNGSRSPTAPTRQDLFGRPVLAPPPATSRLARGAKRRHEPESRNVLGARGDHGGRDMVRTMAEEKGRGSSRVPGPTASGTHAALRRAMLTTRDQRTEVHSSAATSRSAARQRARAEWNSGAGNGNGHRGCVASNLYDPSDARQRRAAATTSSSSGLGARDPAQTHHGDGRALHCDTTPPRASATRSRFRDGPQKSRRDGTGARVRRPTPLHPSSEDTLWPERHASTATAVRAGDSAWTRHDHAADRAGRGSCAGFFGGDLMPFRKGREAGHVAVAGCRGGGVTFPLDADDRG